MRQMKYIPSLCKDSVGAEGVKVAAKYEGHVMLKVPHARDKIMFLKKLNYKFDGEGKVIANEDVTDVLMGMIDIAEESIIEASLKDLATETLYNKDDLFYSSDFQELLGEIGRVVLEGMSPSKNSLA